MYRMDIHISVKTLLSKGYSRRKIAEQLGIHRKVIKRIERELSQGQEASGYQRAKKLDGYDGQIREWLDAELTAELIHKKLVKEQGLKVSYVTVSRLVRALKSDTESFVPMLSAAGEESQVDFGYLGVFTRADGSRVKVWVFCMVLSHSRQGYYEVTTDQSLETFIRCHIRAFEYFGGAPRMVRLDNLKAGVTVPDFFEPLIQEQYAAFLAHYGSAAVPCRVRTPQHKGKVESGVKYVKNNFLRGLGHRDFERLAPDLCIWMDTVANCRVHGTTKRIPAEVWQNLERSALLRLPALRYEFYHVEERKVTRFGHITFANNYYSVPHTLVGEVLRVHSNGSLLRICQGQTEMALHSLASGKGQYVTQQAHLPPHKQLHSPEYYALRLANEIGPEARQLMQLMQQNDSSHWKEKVRGLLHLLRLHPRERVQQACQRALEHGICSYRSVRDICIMLEHTPGQPSCCFEAPHAGAGGMAHDLSLYDRLVP
jgi:transposase